MTQDNQEGVTQDSGLQGKVASDAPLFDALVALFKEAAEAHHQAYLATDGVDPDWPSWYAEYLIEPLRQRLSAHFTCSELVYLLVLVDKELQLRAPGANWATYYARFFLERYT